MCAFSLLLDLDSNPGEMMFQVRNGNVVPQPVPELCTVLFLGSGLLGGCFLKIREKT